VTVRRALVISGMALVSKRRFFGGSVTPRRLIGRVRTYKAGEAQAARHVLEQNPDCRVLMLTTFDLDRYVYAAVAPGASGSLLKDVTPEHLAAAVRLVKTGDALLAPSITRRLVERFTTADRGPGHDTPSPAVHRELAALTPGELEVLTLMGRGLPNAELARALTLSEATVKTHVARIFTKLALRDRAQAVVLAYETGLVYPGDGAR
jgi:DNA-binding NarL/FixJ family response regulator